MKERIKQWASIQIVKNPGRMVLIAILLFNIVFFLLSALLISALALDGTEKMSFIEAAFCTITMILDAGCIQFVVADIGQSGVAVTLLCLVVILIGMISFTGAVIGYVTNYISHFIENANSGKRKLHLSEHFVILNWNSRASEIVNDMLFCDEKQTVVVLVAARKEEIEKEIEERLEDTIAREKKAAVERFADYPFFAKHIAMYKNRFRRNLTVIVREGDVFSSKQLSDISLERARSIVILGNDINNTICKFEHREKVNELGKGNSQTVKTLMQVADITSAEASFDNQRIIVEITDEWTGELVSKIIKAKQVDRKCNIIPVMVNDVLGQILSQFCLMPELNYVYSELFSNKGAEFYSEEHEEESEIDFAKKYFENHNHALPVTVAKSKRKIRTADGRELEKNYAYYVAENSHDIRRESRVEPLDYSIDLHKDYWIEKKNVIILGHNSKCRNIMEGFESFSKEWRFNGEIVNLVVVDDKAHLEKMNYYREYPFVNETVEANIYDKDLISATIDRVVSANIGDTSVLILSDDEALNENIDASALANLVYVREIIDRKLEENPGFDVESIDVIVEIINPKHHDIVNSYSVNNVVISNRYISKMITQISEVEALFDFYNDILTYDTDSDDKKENTYESKEIYIKKVSRYFDSIPGDCTADKLVRAVYEASLDPERSFTVNPTIVLGYVKPGGNVTIFSGNISEIPVSLDEKDKLILFSAH